MALCRRAAKHIQASNRDCLVSASMRDPATTMLKSKRKKTVIGRSCRCARAASKNACARPAEGRQASSTRSIVGSTALQQWSKQSFEEGSFIKTFSNSNNHTLPSEDSKRVGTSGWELASSLLRQSQTKHWHEHGISDTSGSAQLQASVLSQPAGMAEFYDRSQLMQGTSTKRLLPTRPMMLLSCSTCSS